VEIKGKSLGLLEEPKRQKLGDVVTHNSLKSTNWDISAERFEYALDCQSSEAFSVIQLEFLDELSKLLLQNPEYRQFPDLITFGFFIRSKNIQKYFSTHQIPADIIAKGVGPALHIAPSNIPINFAFSWLFGFISGCSNLVRMPSKLTNQGEAFLEAIGTLMQFPAFESLERTNIFFRSERDAQQLDEIMQRIKAIVVWGGDETINHFLEKTTNKGIRQLLFPSRQSSLVVKSEAIINDFASEKSENLLRLLYNDTFLTDCNACSSPSKIFFLGSPNESKKASKLFFEKLNDYALSQIRQPPLVQRMLDSITTKAFDPKRFSLQSHGPAVRTINMNEDNPIQGRALRFGTFSSTFVESIPDIMSLLSKSEQTVTHVGLNNSELGELSALLSGSASSATRLVPMGKALDMNFYWEGRDNPLFLVEFFHRPL
jgi:hypothetical protein